MAIRCTYGAPLRFWYKSNEKLGLWASRDWLPGEKAEYERDVLGW